MLINDKYILRFYRALYGLVFILLIMPWTYYDIKAVEYSFLPRRILFVIMAICAAFIILQRKLSWRKFIKLFIFISLGALHWKLNGYNEPHYFFEFVYLEIAVLFIYAPISVRVEMLKWSPYVLYLLLLKAFFFRIGSYIHGGFLSSNLYAAYIVYLCFIEVYKKRYWNLVPAIMVLYFVGSKASYMAMALLLILGLIRHLAGLQKFEQVSLKISKFNFLNKNYFYWPVGISALFVLIFTLVMVKTEYYQEWTKKMAPSKAESTQNNMVMYGLDKSIETENLRKVLTKTKDMQFEDRKLSVSETPMITDVGMSVGLRLVQYDYMYSNIEKFFWVGNTIKSQQQMFGNNPHSAFIDFIS
jgi:hypothetical protein